MRGRRPTPEPVEFGEWLLNVHDVFLNAQLMSTLMDGQPVVADAEDFMSSPRGRLERAAMRDLYVLIEAFKRSPNEYIDRLRVIVPDELQAVEAIIQDQNRVEALRHVRDYMSHRDVRRYYDRGRLSVTAIGAQWYRAAENAFGRMLLLALQRSR
jgi:hypothetical protein